MERRFSLDEPMNVKKFEEISIKACDDYAQYIRKLSDAEWNAKKTFNDEQSKVWALINRKAEVIHRIISVIFYTICSVIYILCWMFLIFSSNVDFSQYGVATVILAVIITLALVSWAPIIWLIHLFKGDSVKSKVVWGIILAGTGVWTIGVVFSLIVYIISLLNNENKLATKISKLKKYRKMRRRAESQDKEETMKHQAKAKLELDKIKQNTGEYEWLFWEWNEALEPLMKGIETEQRKSPDLKYMKINYGIENVRFLISSVSLESLEKDPHYGIYCGSYETPRKYISCNLEINRERFRRYCLRHYEYKLKQSWNSIHNY